MVVHQRCDAFALSGGMNRADSNPAAPRPVIDLVVDEADNRTPTLGDDESPLLGRTSQAPQVPLEGRPPVQVGTHQALERLTARSEREQAELQNGLPVAVGVRANPRHHGRGCPSARLPLPWLAFGGCSSTTPTRSRGGW